MENEIEILSKEQVINPCKEIDLNDFADDKFKCQCPRCGFRFNQEKKKCLTGNGISKT